MTLMTYTVHITVSADGTILIRVERVPQTSSGKEPLELGPDENTLGSEGEYADYVGSFFR